MSLSGWRLTLLVAVSLISFEIAIVGLATINAPPGYRWLGSTIFNTSDAAVYLNYLVQGKNTLTHANLFSNNPQTARFDLFWSLGGLLTRTGLPQVATQEILRVICTIILAISIVITARAITTTEQHTRLATFFMLSGLSIGWLFSALHSTLFGWNPAGDAPADMITEFAIAPILLGGAHIILSLALQLLAMRWIWKVLNESKYQYLLPTAATLFILSWFHPYFIPLFGLVSILALIANWLKIRTINSRNIKNFLLINASMIPGGLYISWFMWHDAGFRIQQFDRNILSLDPIYLWILPILPLIFSGTWLLTHGIPKEYSWSKRPDWAIAWIIAAAICLCLPFPWQRKYTQGLLTALVIITLPFWLILADWTKKNLYRPIRWSISAVLLFPFLILFRTQAITPYTERYLTNFYVPIAQFKAWEIISTLPTNNQILATSLPANVWTPAYTAHTVWIGHAHETPDFKHRLTQFNAWRQSASTSSFAIFLDDKQIDTVLAVTATDTQRCVAALTPLWHNIFNENGVSVWTRNNLSKP